jgi:hypothetical protein
VTAGSLLAVAALLVSCTLAPAPARETGLTAATLQRWHESKAAGGPTFSGNPAWRAHVEWVEQALRARGVVALERDRFTYPRWWTADDRAAGDWRLTVDGAEVPVASYWAYSGSTPDAGVTGPLVIYDEKRAADIVPGSIVAFGIPALGEPPPPLFAPAGHEFATPDLKGVDRRLATDHWYQVNYATRFGGLGDKLRKAQAAGGLVLFDMGFGRADGIYTFPLLKPGEIGVPGLYLDREASARVRSAAVAGKAATLVLKARRAETETWFLSGVLPGRDYGTTADELVLLITHTDGPNLTQENGGFALVALVQELARTPREQRRRSVLVLLDPQHYMPGRHTVDWFARHPELASRIVASVGVEQLGQQEYAERGAEFVQTGNPETTVFFSQDNPQLIAMATSAITASGLPRTELRVPAHKGQGRWTGLGDIAVERGWPAFGINTEMSAYWSTRPGIESFDATVAMGQLDVLRQLTEGLMETELRDVAPAAN